MTAQTEPDDASASGLVAQAWEQLRASLDDPEHGFHWPVVGTIDGSGAPSARVVVLRWASEDPGEVRFHTDRRSPKCAELAARPELALTFHAGAQRLQLRAVGRGEVVTSGEAFEHGWSSVGRGSRRCYLAPHAPGGVSPDGPSANLPPGVHRHLPDDHTLAAGREHFAVVRCTLDSLDVLHVRKTGHRRARATIRSGRVTGTLWLHP